MDKNILLIWTEFLSLRCWNYIFFKKKMEQTCSFTDKIESVFCEFHFLRCLIIFSNLFVL